MLALKTAHQQTAVYPDAEWMREREREREREAWCRKSPGGLIL